MRKARTYKQFCTPNTFKREQVVIKFSKSGVDQEWTLKFHNGRLRTDEVFTYYDKSTHLRSVVGCKTLQDVLDFLYTYSYAKHFVRITSVSDYTNRRLKAILDFDIDLKSLNGSVYFGRHEVIFKDGYVQFIGHLSPTVNDGTYKINGKRDLLKLTNQLVGRLADELEFLIAIKKLEPILVS